MTSSGSVCGIFKTVGVAGVITDFVQRGCYSQQQLKAPRSHYNFCLPVLVDTVTSFWIPPNYFIWNQV